MIHSHKPKQDVVEDQVGETLYIGKYQDYDIEGLEDFFSDLKSKMSTAQSSGFSDVYVNFNSTIEPYEDNYPGVVEVVITGKRPMTKEEKKKEEEYDRISELAEKLGVSYYEASTVDRLQKLNKIKL